MRLLGNTRAAGFRRTCACRTITSGRTWLRAVVTPSGAERCNNILVLDSGSLLTQMNSRQNRRRAVLLVPGLLMLCMAIFGWGLQYKLSLYQGSKSISHLTPVAKLLSQKERPAAEQSVAHSPARPWPAFLIVMIAFGLPRAAARYSRVGSLQGCRVTLPICLNAIVCRPPPATSFLL
jgi:hypothetical protein